MDPQVTPAAPAPEAAPAPVVEAAPVAPATPPAPVADPADSKPAPTSQEAADAAEEDEWAAARKETYGEDPTAKKEPKKNEPAEPAEDGKKPEADPANPDGKKLDAEPGDGDAADGKSAAPKSADELARDARAAARQAAEQTKAVVADVREKMFKDVPTEMRDSDGDPIRTIEDVQKLVNPRTGEGFTEDEAAQWLLAAQQQFNKNLAATEKQIEDIAETNIAIKAEADYVNAKYGDILKADPALRDRLWAQFEKTLVKDEASGIITKMPVSLEEFYEVALDGRATPAAPAAPVAKPGEATPPAPDPAKVAADAAAADAKTKADAETARQQARADRSDIYVPPTDPKGVDKDDDEWGKAAKDYYGDRLK